MPEGVAYSDGDDAAKLCAHFWFTPDEWQGNILHSLLARDEHGRLRVISAGLSVPRQNGKNGSIEALEFYLLVSDTTGETHILHTAHQVKTSKKAFNRLAAAFEDRSHPEICALVKTIRRTNGEEAIILKSGASIEYSARSRSAARGFDAITLVVYDEAQELTDEQVEALMSTLAASPSGDRQTIYTGTPPGPNSPGTVFRKRRKAALTNPSARTCWMEWGVSECPPADATFEDVLDDVYATNPAMGIRLDEEFTREEFDAMSIDGFARERLGWWVGDESGADHIVTRSDWEACATEGIDPTGAQRTALGLKFSPDGATWALAGCKVWSGGHVAVELIGEGETAHGTRILAEKLLGAAHKASCVVIDGRAGAEALVQRMADEGAPRGYVVRPRTSDVISAAQQLVEAIRTHELEHTSQEQLTDSVLGAVRRPIGGTGGWGIGTDGNARSDAAEAASLAMLGARTSRRRPGRKQRIL